MQKVRVTGTRFLVVFRNAAGDVIEKPITEKEYRSRDSVGRFNLTLEKVIRGWVIPPGYTCLDAYEPFTFDTPDGQLADEQYAIQSTSKGDFALVKKPARQIVTIPASEIVNDELTPAGQAMVDAIPPEKR